MKELGRKKIISNVFQTRITDKILPVTAVSVSFPLCCKSNPYDE